MERSNQLENTVKAAEGEENMKKRKLREVSKKEQRKLWITEIVMIIVYCQSCK